MDFSWYGNALRDSVITWISLVSKVLATSSRISLIDEIIPTNPIRPMRGGGLQVCGGVNDCNVQYTNSTVLTSNSKTLMKTVISDTVKENIAVRLPWRGVKLISAFLARIGYTYKGSS